MSRGSGGTSSVTMRDVAKAAGVSIATVSHVINDKPGARIGDDARRRVHDAVAELGYRPNALAKTLSQGGSRFIGLVADQIATTPFAGQIIHGAQDEAWRHGYVLLVANTDGNADAENEAIAMMLEHQVRGILYSSWYHREISVPEQLELTDTVLVDCFARGSGLCAVVPDEEQGGRAATEKLIAAGHQRIAFINTTTPSPAQTGRLAGYRAALDAAGIEHDPSFVLDASPEQEGGYGAAGRIVESGVTAVFCHNDRVAMGLYDGLREHGLRVPDDVAVVGFDNQEVIAAHLRPPLTSVALPHYDLGVVGVRILLGLDTADQAIPTLVACPVIQRQSV
ncbi:LacI family DNA-binding transcriptional regulator [Microbacterium saccharophilum]|uniref:LacI family DNA-binding transcriptional regulator n=2 Tax=Microbacterium saccharophilum TaxID=1213358 RepID=A0A5C8HVS9_9MICO|nr:LacI family DNA-binding transcriptional regulator [Microbacterium saccharophilum]TXK08935.1 LacI family DNA-binding transcriptional regulator [Microbacterium saccharophilum]GEP48037.1 alanine racemase [Microbacterium saccharophilum]